MSLVDIAKALLGFSAYAPAPANAATRALDDPDVIEARRIAGGGLAPLPVTRLRWYLKDLEAAQYAADSGDLSIAAQIYRAMRRDGTISGLLAARTSGLMRLPRTFSGADVLVEQLKTRSNAQELFDSVFPPSELKLVLQDGIMLCVAVAELVPVPGRKHPIMIRHEPEFLTYRWSENKWYFRSIAGLLPITPGDGRWILHLPGGRHSPWQFGAWIPCGAAFIEKQHAKLYRGNFGSKLANPARVIKSPVGAQEPERVGALAKMAAWGVNTVFELPVGWDASLLESKGEGHQVWKDDEASANEDIKMALAGQVVTSDGGTGFDKGDLFKTIRSDMIQTDGNDLAATLNTQALPAVSVTLQGPAVGLKDPAAVAWDTTPPQDRQREATLIASGADAITKLESALKPVGYETDTAALVLRLGLPARKRAAEVTVAAKLDIAPTDLAKTVRVREVRASRNLPALGDDRDDLTISELDAAAKAAAAPPAPGAPSTADGDLDQSAAPANLTP